MGDKTGISWTDATWNPIRGCSRVSQGCVNCYAEGQAARFSGPGQPYEGLAKWVGPEGAREARWTGKVAFVEHMLDQPLRWTKPRRIFVNSMSDLFHEKIPDEWIDRIFAVMALAPHHTFQVLTKRPERMRAYFAQLATDDLVLGGLGRWHAAGAPTLGDAVSDERWEQMLGEDVPLPNVWLGVSAEDQATANERIPLLLQTPAAVRWISAEPLLGPIDLTAIRFEEGDAHVSYDTLTGDAIVLNSDSPSAFTDDNPVLDWVVVGGESGRGARPMHPDWARDLHVQTAAAGVAYFFKQWGEWAWAPDSLNFDDALAWGRDRFGETVIAEAHSSGHTAFLVGKHRSGDELGGRQWHAYPEVAA